MSSNESATTQTRRVSLRDLQRKKRDGEKWAMLTAYDATWASILDAAGVPVLLVGDSAASLVFGYESTVRVSLGDMLTLTSAVVRSTQRALIVADLPFGTYEVSDEQAVRTAVDVVRASGAHAVKLEGGLEVTSRIRAVSRAGVSVFAHIGCTPQRLHGQGRYRVRGRTADDQGILLEEGAAAVEAGAAAVVVELVTVSTGERLAAHLPVPVIGIGAGKGTDAQVLVLHDLIGLTDPSNVPSFARRYVNFRELAASVIRDFLDDVGRQAFPSTEESFS